MEFRQRRFDGIRSDSSAPPQSPPQDSGARVKYLLVRARVRIERPVGGHGWNQFAAGELERTLQMAWIGVAIAAGFCEALGLCAVVARRPPHIRAERVVDRGGNNGL